MANKKATTKEEKMKIEAKIDRLIDKEGMNLKGIASVTIGDAFAVHGIRISESQNGLFISMPSNSYQDKDGNTKYSDIFHPISAEARTEIGERVKEAYQAALEQQQNVEVQEEESPFLEQTM